MNKADASIPIPDFLNVEKKLIPQQRNRKMEKHKDAYEEFCKWAASPTELRDPSTQKEFESLWKLPRNYTSKWKEKEDFQAKRLNHFWNRLFDWYPDVVYAIYRRAKRNSTADAKVFSDIIGKRLEIDKPVGRMTPFVMVGVPQDKIDQLFIPQTYKKVTDQTIDLNKAEDGEVIEVEKA